MFGHTSAIVVPSTVTDIQKNNYYKRNPFDIHVKQNAQ